MPDCKIPAFPADIAPHVEKQADGSFVISGEDFVEMMQWVSDLVVREQAEADCLQAGQR